MYSKEMFLKSEKISKKIKKCNYWWHFCLVYLVYLFQFCLVPLFVISVQSSDSSFVHKTGLIFLVGSFYIVSDQYSTDFSILPRVRSTALCGQKQKEFFLKPPIITCGGSTIFMVLKTENEHAISSLNTFSNFSCRFLNPNNFFQFKL